MPKPFLIDFEGVEGCGKTTMVKLIAKELRNLGLRVITEKEPGGNIIGAEIKRVIVKNRKNPPNSIAELFLFLAARAQVFGHIKNTQFKRKTIILWDRSYPATFAFQYYARGLSRYVPVNLQRQLTKLATFSQHFNLIILLDIDPKLSLKRKHRQNRFEKEPLAFHRKVRQGYRLLTRRDRNSRWLVFDARLSIKKLKQQIALAILKELH